MALTLEVGSSLLTAKSDDDASDTESVKRAEKAVEWLSLGLRLCEKFDRESERKKGLVKEGARTVWTSGVVRVIPFVQNHKTQALTRVLLLRRGESCSHLVRTAFPSIRDLNQLSYSLI